MKTALLSLVLLSSVLFAADVPVDRIAAIVNAEAITASEVNAVYSQMLRMRPDISGDQAEKLKKDVLNEMITAKLIIQEAKKRNYEVSRGELDGAMDQVKAQNGGTENLNKLLAQEGMTRDELEGKIRDNLLSDKLVNDNVRKEVKLDPKDYQELYEKNKEQFTENKVTFKRVKVPFGSDDAKAKAEALDLAKKYKAGTEIDGDAVTMMKEDMNPEIAGAVFLMKEGSISEPVKLSDGYYIFKVIKIEAGKVLTLDDKVDFQGQKVDLREKLKAVLFQDRFSKKKNEFVAKLKEKAVIEIR